MGKKL